MPWPPHTIGLLQANLYTGVRCIITCAVINQLFDKLFRKHEFSYFFQQLSLKLIDNCTSSKVTLPLYKDSLCCKMIIYRL